MKIGWVGVEREVHVVANVAASLNGISISRCPIKFNVSGKSLSKY